MDEWQRNTPETGEYWQGVEAGELRIRRCTRCGQAHAYPRPHCPFCFGDTVWEKASGGGTLYSYSTMKRGDGFSTIAYVTLSEGPTMLCGIVDADPERLRIDMPLEMVVRAGIEGGLAPFFRPVDR